MLRSQTPLLVYPVPFTALDARGMPAAAVRFDPQTGRANEVHFIGCDREHRLVERRKRAEGRQSVYASTFRYDLAPQAITHTDYHVQRIRHGELIAADAATARIAGVPFVQPVTAFERARYAAIRRWEAEYGTPPPVDQWPSLRLVTPDDDLPSTAPAHGASIRAKGGQERPGPPAGPSAAVPGVAGQGPVGPAPAPPAAGAPPEGGPSPEPPHPPLPAVPPAEPIPVVVVRGAAEVEPPAPARTLETPGAPAAAHPAAPRSEAPAPAGQGGDLT
jgi:hypothetical protein